MSLQPLNFNAKIFIAKMEKKAKNQILASTTVLSYLGGEMIKISGLSTNFRHLCCNCDL